MLCIQKPCGLGGDHNDNNNTMTPAPAVYDNGLRFRFDGPTLKYRGPLGELPTRLYSCSFVANYCTTIQKLLLPSRFYACTSFDPELYFSSRSLLSFPNNSRSCTSIHIFLGRPCGLFPVSFQGITALTVLFSFPRSINIPDPLDPMTSYIVLCSFELEAHRCCFNIVGVRYIRKMSASTFHKRS